MSLSDDHEIRAGGEMTRKGKIGLGAGLLAVAATATVFALVLGGGGSEGFASKFAGGDPDQQGASQEQTVGEGPDTFEAWLSAQRTYPANVIPPAVADSAQTAFEDIAKKDAKNGDPGAKGRKWQLFGPTSGATEPGVISFSGATNDTASRITALLVSPDCGDHGDHCRVWVGAAGGGVWRTDDALGDNPDWKQVKPDQLDQNSVGTLTLDASDTHGAETLYLGTGEGNKCSSGCEAGVGIYKSTNGGDTWKKLDDKCVDNATYHCAMPGKDAFLGRGINSIVIDPNDSDHIFVGSALGVRGLSHTIGAVGETQRLEPGANEPGLYESTDGGTTFTEVWDGAKPSDAASVNGTPGVPISAGITDVALDPKDPSVVYASGFDAGAWRRDAGAAQTAFQQIFAPQFSTGDTRDRTMFALTVKNNHTRVYLTDGQANGDGAGAATASNFWRTDLGDQPAAALKATQASCASPDAATHVFPATYTGWQCLTSKTTSNPYFATDDFCWAQCWYDERVYTPTGMPDTVYVIGANQYGEQPCDTNGVGCGNGRSDGREVLYSTTAGDPAPFTWTGPDSTTHSDLRTFTDLSYDATQNHPSWCAYTPYIDNGCVNAPNGIHPDQHVISINPGNPTQIFEGSDGGMIRTSGDFADISSQCDEPHRNGGGPLPATSGSYLTCKRVLSRVPTVLGHIDRNLSSTLQFINVAIDPSDSRHVLGGTQDNGTWSNMNKDDRSVFTQVIYGDGGNAAFDATKPTWMANEFTGGFGDVNFENGEPTAWVIATGPIVASKETISFYWPQIGDPNPAVFNGQVTHPLYEGAQHVWRSWAFGGGVTGHVPQDTSPAIDPTDGTYTAEKNCPEFVTSGGDPSCGDFLPLGGPAGTNNAGDLTGTTYGSDRTGGSVSWLARDGIDHGTLWAATSAGRVFVTHNADASDPAAVNWLRIDSSTAGGSPTRYPSGIYVDATNPHHAWISYSGYNAATPTTLGHVFEVTENGVAGGGTFTNLNVESGTSAFPTPTNDGDLPVADVVRDDATKTLYVATDFGVLRGDNDGKGGWHVTDMPRYEVMHLEIVGSSRVPTCMSGKKCDRVLYAATHSQGIWRMDLGPAPPALKGK
jgi:hypothetical protein